MPDMFAPEQRSRIMARVKNRDTAPEMKVPRLLHSLGYRFRLRRRDLPGTPDVTLPRHRKVIFIHGCFWHGHENCRRGARPTSNTDFWNAKIDTNRRRDAQAVQQLLELGWTPLIVWECETKDDGVLRANLLKFMQAEDDFERP